MDVLLTSDHATPTHEDAALNPLVKSGWESGTLKVI